ncbi:unnamed protein product, partial [Prorocentrum cordatum]
RWSADFSISARLHRQVKWVTNTSETKDGVARPLGMELAGRTLRNMKIESLPSSRSYQ